MAVTIVQAVIFNQANAPWGLARISQQPRLPADADATSLSYNFRNDNSAGNGVDVYVVDTGVRLTHTEFQGRARYGATFGGYADNDGNGHGTHIAGIIAGAQYGVAKRANIIAVKVLGDDGTGTPANIIQGLQWSQQAAQQTGRPSIVFLSAIRGPRGPGHTQPLIML